MIPKDLPPPEMGEIVFGVVPLGRHRGAYRYAIYLLSPVVERGGPLWGPYTEPGESDKARKAAAADTWPGLTYHPRPATGRDNLPAYHFALDFAPVGWGTDSATEAFANAMARRIGRSCKIRVLHGWNATTWQGNP